LVEVISNRDRDQRSDTMMGRPRRQRRLALIVLLVAAGLAVAAFPFRQSWWGGWILAVAEAGIVGGLADWFAVTALFRRPLGLPIPHTALIPANWELMAKRVGSMVGDRVLTKEYVTHEVSRLDLAGLISQAAERVTREDLDAVTRIAARWILDQLPADTIRDGLAALRALVVRAPAAPMLAAVVEFGCRHGWDQRFIDGLGRALAEALDRPAFREVLGTLVDDVLERYRHRSGPYPRLWLGIANLVGLLDRDRIVAAIHGGLRSAVDEPEHPLRQRAGEAIRELPSRLRKDARWMEHIEAAKEELLSSAFVQQFLDDAAARIHRALRTDLSIPRSQTVRWVTGWLEGAREALVTDAGLRADLDRWIKERAIELVERHHGRIAVFIEQGVHVLGPEGAVRLIEEHAGDDLQYIRVNGTIVGGLAGGGLYGIHLLLRALNLA
jgi:uncharacterized membrane-anchored protein YjiN (DUF445 family)